MCYLLFVTNTEHLIPENIKYFWSFLNGLKRDSNLPEQMSYNGTVLSTPEEITEVFASYFQLAYSDISDVNLDVLDSVPFASVWSAHNFSTEEMYKKLKSLDVSKAAGLDGVPALMLKPCAESLAMPLKKLFQLSLDFGHFPKMWKSLKFLPVFKSGDKCGFVN